MTIINILILMFFHWIGDFLLQTDWMATTKSKVFSINNLDRFNPGTHLDDGGLALTLHSLIWASIMTFGLFVLGVHAFSYLIVAWGLFLVSHWFIDCFTSKLNSFLWLEKRTHDFFVSIGFDQWLHLTEILLIAYFAGIK